MRLRSLFMILLLCMTVGTFSACTGDDGVTGPMGPQGEPGVDAEITDEVIDDIADQIADQVVDENLLHYGFLSNWGYPDGVNCNDLETMDPFPGPVELDPYEDDSGNALIASFEAQCGATLSTLDVATDLVGKYLGLTAGGNDGAADAELVFIKTMAGEESNLGDPVLVPETDHTPPAMVETTTQFAGGPFLAELATDGSGEGLQRLLLYSECAKGTPPPDLRGEWRGVLKNEVIQAINSQTKLPVLTKVTKTTTKICIRLDAMPNAVKCFIDVNDVDGTVTQQIAIYKDGKAMTVGKAVPSIATLPAQITGNAAQQFFGTASSIFNATAVTADLAATPPVRAVEAGDVQVGKLCGLIKGANKGADPT